MALCPAAYEMMSASSRSGFAIKGDVVAFIAFSIILRLPYVILAFEAREEYAVHTASIARVVAPGIPRHITQWGNRRQETFFGAEDYRGHMALWGEWCRGWEVESWACCLVPNHGHLIAA
jgi:hypothetical protein